MQLARLSVFDQQLGLALQAQGKKTGLESYWFSKYFL